MHFAKAVYPRILFYENFIEKYYSINIHFSRDVKMFTFKIKIFLLLLGEQIPAPVGRANDVQQ